MAKNNNGVPRVDRTARIPAKDVPVPNSGTGNPGSWPFGPGPVSTQAKNPATTIGKPSVNRAKAK